MWDKQNESSNPTATLDSKAREAIKKGLMDQQTLWLLQDAGEACKQARTGEPLSARAIESIRHYFQSSTASDISDTKHKNTFPLIETYFQNSTTHTMSSNDGYTYVQHVRELLRISESAHAVAASYEGPNGEDHESHKDHHRRENHRWSQGHRNCHLRTHRSCHPFDAEKRRLIDQFISHYKQTFNGMMLNKPPKQQELLVRSEEYVRERVEKFTPYLNHELEFIAMGLLTMAINVDRDICARQQSYQNKTTYKMPAPMANMVAPVKDAAVAAAAARSHPQKPKFLPPNAIVLSPYHSLLRDE
ncbi:MAG: hypothetical protein Q9221_001369 [Calogaya cf. arnoldii]